ncbi:hypothetical protein LX83_004049 [Goodfellowiella coeruleoviolacea]|uniref:Uncharacterized protein n=2 Tax=Goodfellowiella coeruleoviolacea TaxID=334858 RepID=A0AAE3GFD8_9PSEU|nr:hypothetical protein [Goodfellowiella coeruleoviolacea]
MAAMVPSVAAAAPAQPAAADCLTYLDGLGYPDDSGAYGPACQRGEAGEVLACATDLAKTGLAEEVSVRACIIATSARTVSAD